MSEETKFLDISHFEKLNKIGEGGFGKVFRVKDKITGNIYAAKISIREFTQEMENDMINLLREVNIMIKLNHPCILKFIGYSPTNFKNSHKPVIITEYSKNNSLFTIIDLERKGLSPSQWDSTKKLICIYGIASGMSYLHEHKIIHRDLKSLNILMDDNFLPKIADFGLSKILHQNQESMSLQSEIAIKGTANYLAPEIWNNFLYTPAVDVYAFSMIIYEIMTLTVPFEKVPFIQIGKKVTGGERPSFTCYIDSSYKNLIERCWSQKAEERPSFSEIVQELKNEPGFITPSIDEDEYRDYIDFIDEYVTTFDRNKQIDLYNNYAETQKFKSENKIPKFKQQTIQQQQQQQQQHEQSQSKKQNSSFFSGFFNLFSREIKPVNFFTMESFAKLEKPCQELVIQAQSDKEIQFIVGRSLIEEKHNFPKNIPLGIRYLEESISQECISSVVYLSSLLIEGDQVAQDLKKAQNYLIKYIKSNDSRVLYLYGKLLKKLNKHSEARMYFEKSASIGNIDSMYEYGFMLFFGEGGQSDLNESLMNFSISKKEGNVRSLKFLEYYDEMLEEGMFNLPFETQQFIMLNIIDTKTRSNLLINCDQIQMLYNNGSLKSAEFNNILHKFSNVLIELKHSYESFESIYELIINISKTNTIGLRIFCSDRLLSCNFNENTIIKEITIELSVEKITDNAFMNCKSLEKVSLPSSIKEIMKCVFAGCSSLKEIVIPSSIKLIDDYTFSGCSSLREITIPSSVKIIGEYVFDGCCSLREINIPSSVKVIGDGCFRGCSLLKEITIPRSVSKINMHTFDGCKYLTHVYASKNINDQIIENAKCYSGDSYKENSCRLFLIAANNGNACGMLEYGNRLYNGNGVLESKEKAAQYYKMAAENGETDGMVNYGYALFNGIGIKQNNEEACKYFKMAADKGNTIGIANYGMMLENGFGTQKDYKEAARYYKMAAEKGYSNGMVNYGSMLQNGTGIPQNSEEACKYFKMAADKGNTIGIANYGVMLENGFGTQKNYKEAARYYKMAAEKGYSNGMVNYGNMLKNGLGIPQNSEEACKYFKMAADDGILTGMNNYGSLISSGLGVPIDYKEACKYFKMAIDKGHLLSMVNYGFMLDNGLGVPVDHDEASCYYKTVIDKGESTVIHDFAHQLEEGKIFIDYKEQAFRYYKIAADAGCIDSAFDYGRVLEYGIGIQPNKQEALKYYKIAADKGCIEAGKSYKRLKQ